LTASGLTLALALPAAAQSTQSQSSTGSGSGQQSGGMSSQNSMAARQKVKQDLEQAGFTNVQVAPESFAVKATDKQGRPVMMLIDPNSALIVTGTTGAGQSNSASSGTSSK
jgi:hypothetical protein